jgi:hypothetical protein
MELDEKELQFRYSALRAMGEELVRLKDENLDSVANLIKEQEIKIEKARNLFKVDAKVFFDVDRLMRVAYTIIKNDKEFIKSVTWQKVLDNYNNDKYVNNEIDIKDYQRMYSKTEFGMNARTSIEIGIVTKEYATPVIFWIYKRFSNEDFNGWFDFTLSLLKNNGGKISDDVYNEEYDKFLEKKPKKIDKGYTPDSF